MGVGEGLRWSSMTLMRGRIRLLVSASYYIQKIEPDKPYLAPSRQSIAPDAELTFRNR